VFFGSALHQGTSSSTAHIHCRFNILAPLAADFISADYPYLRQITECAVDLIKVRAVVENLRCIVLYVTVNGLP
jgi:hypothetical protein